MDLNFSSLKLITQRKLQGLSQEKLAEKAGINIRTLQRIEKNEVKPQLYTIGNLANSLGIKIEDLFDSSPTTTVVISNLNQLSFIHFLALAGCFFPLGNILVPIFLWLYKKQVDEAWKYHVIKVINFQLSWLTYLMAILILYFTLEQLAFLVFLIPIIIVSSLAIFPLCSGILVLKSKKPFYPFTINFLKNKHENIS
jgi:DNA-binding XRE family transcriptional regulator